MAAKPMPPEGSPEEEGAESPQMEQGEQAQGQGDQPPQQMNEDQAKAATDAISQKATSVINGMQELGFVLSKLGADQGALKELAGQFQAFMQTLESILGGGQGNPGEQNSQGNGQLATSMPGSGPSPRGGNTPMDANAGPRGVPMA